MKTIIYQLLPRLFGNDNPAHVFNGSIEQNGCGKMKDINTTVLRRLKNLGVTHVWYTGLLEHATCTDYSQYGIKRDHSAMVKGKAGSPYAVKDYYDIDPDLATNPAMRFREFKALVERTHKMGMGVIMDFIPNHVARQYCSDKKPKNVQDLGENDNGHQAFSPSNNFYYIPGSELHCRFDMKGTEQSPYHEMPAKATGNDCFSPYPQKNDWYETVKLNYGIDYPGGGERRFYPIPDTWEKMLQILLYWAEQGIDAFRCDMAEMVPCEFWDWAIKQVKEKYPDLLFIGEVYNPDLYRQYIYQGHFDYLYDKVGLYDTLRGVMCGNRPASAISDCWKCVGDIQEHMLNFLENHDEQRIASEFFASEGSKAKAALIVSLCMNTNPFMLYFGQEFGEQGMDVEGFSGMDGRTSIFDYWSLPLMSLWRNGGKYNTDKLPTRSAELYTYYKYILSLVKKERALAEGSFFDLMYVNTENPYFDTTKEYAFIRKYENEVIFVVCNFGNIKKLTRVNLPQHAFEFLGIPVGKYKTLELLSSKRCKRLLNWETPLEVEIEPYSGAMIKIEL